MTALPTGFLSVPFAHRGLHDIAAGCPENSRAAFAAAIAGGYGIELDVQRSADDVAMVFHDYDLGRLTGATGPLRAMSAAELGAVALCGGDEGIPTLTEVLALVAGQVPLLIEIKDQDGALGPGVGPLESAVADAVRGYDGPFAVMSFNPHSMAEMARLSPGVARGLITGAFDPASWPVPPERCAELRAIPDYDRVGAVFISHDHNDLENARVRELKDGGAGVVCWTIRTAAQDALARRIADTVTFEGYAASVP